MDEITISARFSSPFGAAGLAHDGGVRLALTAGSNQVCEPRAVTTTPPSRPELEELVASLREEVARLKQEIRRIQRDQADVPPHYL